MKNLSERQSRTDVSRLDRNDGWQGPGTRGAGFCICGRWQRESATGGWNLFGNAVGYIRTRQIPTLDRDPDETPRKHDAKPLLGNFKLSKRFPVACGEEPGRCGDRNRIGWLSRTRSHALRGNAYQGVSRTSFFSPVRKWNNLFHGTTRFQSPFFALNLQQPEIVEDS